MNDVFFSDFPQNCEVYDGPKSIQCYITLWQRAGCLLEGDDMPLNLTFIEQETIDGLNIRLVKVDSFT